MPQTTTPEPSTLQQHRKRAGSLGGKGGSHKNKVRAGHAAWAKMLRRLAKKAKAKGLHDEAKELIRRAEAQEKKAA